MRHQIGEGAEKKVFYDSTREEVVKVYKDSAGSFERIETRSRYRIAQFYLKKVVNLLFFLDLHCPRPVKYEHRSLENQGKATTVERHVFTTEKHRQIQSELQRKTSHVNRVSSEEELRSMLNEGGFEHLLRSLKRYGLVCDSKARNFDYIDGKLWYFDDFIPWYVAYGNRLVKSYKSDVIIHSAYHEVQNGSMGAQQYKMVCAYLERLDSLFQEEKKDWKDSID